MALMSLPRVRRILGSRWKHFQDEVLIPKLDDLAGPDVAGVLHANAVVPGSPGEGVGGATAVPGSLRHVDAVPAALPLD